MRIGTVITYGLHWLPLKAEEQSTLSTGAFYIYTYFQ
jgi:hypothetical protein